MTNPILVDIPLPIETPRLILRNVLPGDGELFYRAKLETLEELRRWQPWAQDIGDAAQNELLIWQECVKFIERKCLMLFGIDKPSGELAVVAALHSSDWDLRIFELGFWTVQSFQGRGFASEAGNALTRFAFGALNATKVNVTHTTGNDASAAVIAKLGFTKEGVFVKSKRIAEGNITNEHYYARFDDKDLPELKVSWRKS